MNGPSVCFPRTAEYFGSDAVYLTATPGSSTLATRLVYPCSRWAAPSSERVPLLGSWRQHLESSLYRGKREHVSPADAVRAAVRGIRLIGPSSADSDQLGLRLTVDLPR